MKDPRVTSDMIIIGTSGSLDYLNDSTANQRFWRVAPEVSEAVIGQAPCDGVHDESAPAQYLCTRCYPQAIGSEVVEVDEEAVPEEIE
jgi:hypothetical protein